MRRLRLAGTGAALLLLAACSAESKPSDTLTVFAASSLTDAFGELGRRFEAAHPGAEVRFSFGASSALVDQIRNGAPAHVVATADEASMQPLVAAGLATDAKVFARNRLAVLVPTGNPEKIGALSDLARPGLTVVLCAVEVPCGRLAGQAFDRARVKVTPKSYEANVKAVVSKVALGEADAGVVYVTDVQAAGDKVEGVDIPAEHNVATAYSLARVQKTVNPAMADAFVAFVLSDRGRQALAAFGFDAP